MTQTKKPADFAQQHNRDERRGDFFRDDDFDDDFDDEEEEIRGGVEWCLYSRR